MAETTEIQKREAQALQPERIESGPTYRPNVDIIEKENELLLQADIPGVKAEQIEINYERGQLSIVGRVKPRQKPETAYLLREYGVGDFVRTFQVGEGIDAGKIEAEVRNGVLTLHLPKTEAMKARTIPVKTK
jgi:HSP20 family molecular chaperone IbpA